MSGVRINIADLTSLDWIQRHVHPAATSASLAPLSDAGGLSGKMRKVEITSDDSSTPSTLILKSYTNLERSKTLQLAREAFFYNALAAKLGGVTPKVYHAFGDMDTGEKVILMQDLSSTHVQAGYFFGNCSPHNWGKDLVGLTGGLDQNSEERVALTRIIALHAFKIAAKMNSTFWKDKSLFKHSWLRSVGWLQGNGETEWKQHQETAFRAWRAEKSRIDDGKAQVKWDSRLVKIMDASFAKTSWGAFQDRIHAPDYVFSLVHGDYHPANLMWRKENEELVLLDWEVVGVGSGAQDCAQFLISHMYPKERRDCEYELLRGYYSALIAGGVAEKDYSFDRCKADYVAGGVARWVWLLGILTSMCPPEWNQFFHDQLLAFALDHGVTAETVEMPRV
ncbi:hypothetical protein HDU99_001813 [Rhizoclosmatium hyalinum]|nr:hypothetical protein HDU99_001813 [Rhizoclosmatium hyalinum]